MWGRRPCYDHVGGKMPDFLLGLLWGHHSGTSLHPGKGGYLGFYSAFAGGSGKFYFGWSRFFCYLKVFCLKLPALLGCHSWYLARESRYSRDFFLCLSAFSGFWFLHDPIWANKAKTNRENSPCVIPLCLLSTFRFLMCDICMPWVFSLLSQRKKEGSLCSIFPEAKACLHFKNTIRVSQLLRHPDPSFSCTSVTVSQLAFFLQFIPSHALLSNSRTVVVKSSLINPLLHTFQQLSTTPRIKF